MFYRRGCFLGGTISLIFIYCKGFMGVLEDHDCESTLFRLIFGLEAKLGV